MTLKFWLPWPPSANRYWRTNRGRTHVSAEAKLYKHQVQHIALGEKLNKHFSSRLSIQITAFPPDKRRRDIDNLIKVVLDSLQHAGVYDDDSQIDYISIERKFLGVGELFIILEELDE